MKKAMIRACFAMCLASAILINGTIQSQNNPPLQVVIYDSAATTGYIFMAPYILTPPYVYDHPQMILDQYGNTVYYRVLLNGGIAATTADFKLQPNGLMSFYSPILGKFYLMDSTFTVVDSVIAANGFGTDTHELQILDDGHYLILGREMRVVDLRSYHWFGESHNLPGSRTAEVTGSVVQELDENKVPVFEWKSHDNFDFGDVDSVWLSNPTSVDWTHSNALERDHDGNILLSSRHLNEITKINRSDGSIMWRFGGKHNEFTFVDDTLGFTGQHDIRRLASGHVTLWDNGQYTDPPVGRALEYDLDETSKIATLEMGYIQDSGMFSYAMGNHQRLQNNDRFLTYGFITPPYPMVAHIKPDSTKVLEIYGPPGYGCYRAFNYETLPFTISRPEVHCEKTGDVWYLVAESGHDEYLWSTGATAQSIPVTATGRYQVFVPYGGGGHVGSEIIDIKNLSEPCSPDPVPTTRTIRNVVISEGQNTCFDATQTIYLGGNGTSVEVESGGAATFIAGLNILFYPGVTVYPGGYMLGTITTEAQYCLAGSPSLVHVKEVMEDPVAITDKSFFRLYPNPTTGSCVLESTGNDIRGVIAVEIYGMHGARVFSETLTGSANNPISLRHLPAGIYIVRIVASGAVARLKLVKRD